MVKSRLVKEIITAQKKNEQVICIYGDCFPGIQDVCAQYAVDKISGHYCYEVLLGTERFQQLVDEIPGTYFLEKDLILNFEKYCSVPLGLDDDEIREYYFQHYSRLVYVLQPGDHDLLPKAKEIAEFLGLSLEIVEADYSYLEKELIELVEQKRLN